MADNSSYQSYLINLFKVMVSGDLNEKIFITKKHELTRINAICEKMFSEDYYLHLINNEGGSLCSHYPPSIIIPYKKENSDIKEESIRKMSNNNIIMTFINKAINARCRSRFPVPVINFKNKFICRSSTLSGSMEIYGKRYFSNMFGNVGNMSSNNSSSGKDHFDEIRGHDKNLLQHLKVKYIFDLMLENKKLMFGLPVSSSEKIDRHNRYRDFSIISLPYPGCEFFLDWSRRRYPMDYFYFEWEKIEINSRLNIPLEYCPAMCHNIKWENYEKWTLTELTSNYLKLMLGILIEDEYGILIHCISGWDRTPLFASLIRCLLWADGLIHNSLSPIQIVYLTLAYDWYLFGHQTKTRLQCGEEILYFNFCFLKYAATDNTLSTHHIYGSFVDYLSNRLSKRPQSENFCISETSIEDKMVERREKLEKLFEIFNRYYAQEVSKYLNKSSKKHSKNFISSASSLVNGIVGSFSNPTTPAPSSSSNSLNYLDKSYDTSTRFYYKSGDN